jgi:prevent-host-death family protein
MQMNMLEAKTKLSQLVAAALRGEEVLIARNGVPIVQIVPAPVHKKAMPFGFLEGRAPIADSLLFGMSDEDADHFLKEGIR